MRGDFLQVYACSVCSPCLPMPSRGQRTRFARDQIGSTAPRAAGCWRCSTGRAKVELVLLPENVKSVLSATPIHYRLAATQLPKWIIKQLDKARRAFLWTGQDTATGGKCLV